MSKEFLDDRVILFAMLTLSAILCFWLATILMLKAEVPEAQNREQGAYACDDQVP